VCEGGDAAAVALAAQEAVAAYAATHAAIQLDEGFVETGRTVEKRETEDGCVSVFACECAADIDVAAL
jgi:hypothetical protein